MGTSSMYTGPSRNPLLPSDFNEPNNSTTSDDMQGENETPTPDVNNNNESQSESDQDLSTSDSGWRNAKTAMSNYANGRTRNYQNAISRHVKAYGGAKGASRTATSGIKTTINLGRFLSVASTEGIRKILNQAKITFEGRTAKDILNDIINFLAPIPVTKEDSVARKALIRTLEVLYEKLEDENKDISSLDNIDKELLNEMIPIHIESYIYERIINDLGSRIETKSSTPTDAINKEKEIKEYINSKVETELKGRDFSEIDFNSQYIEKEVEGLFNQCYKVMEDML